MLKTVAGFIAAILAKADPHVEVRAELDELSHFLVRDALFA